MKNHLSLLYTVGAIICGIFTIIFESVALWYFIAANAMFILSRVEALHERFDELNKK
jgi:uncharacterized membrane protein YoaK (UPF0700 family)